MFRLSSIAIAAVLAALALSNQVGSAQSGAPADFMAARTAFNEAGANGDKAAYARYLAPDVTWIDISGRLRDHDALVSDVRKGAPPQPTPVDVITYQDAVVITGHRVQNNSRYIQVWTREGGTWRLVAHHGAPLGSAPPAGSASRTPAPVGSQAERDAVLRNLNAVDDAAEKGDVAAYARLITDRFIRVGNTGTLSDRKTRLDDLKKAGPGAPAVVPQELSTRIHGSIAVTTDRSGNRRDGSPFPPSRRTTVHVKQAGTWLEAASINSRIVPATP